MVIWSLDWWSNGLVVPWHPGGGAEVAAADRAEMAATTEGGGWPQAE